MAYPPPLQPNYYTPPPGQPPPAGLAVASMVCGIVSIPLLCFWPVSIPLAIVAVVLGLIARGQVRRGTAGGGGMAVAGIVCGAIPLVIVLVGICIVVVLAIAGSASSGVRVHHWP